MTLTPSPRPAAHAFAIALCAEAVAAVAIFASIAVIVLGGLVVTKIALKPGEEIRDGKIYGWTGQLCKKCNGTAEDFSDENAPYTTCRKCGGTGEEWGLMPGQPGTSQ